VDRDAENFKFVITYIKQNLSLPLDPSNKKDSQLINELEFWGLWDLSP
jgi:hypothetical protein